MGAAAAATIVAAVVPMQIQQSQLIAIKMRQKPCLPPRLQCLLL